MLQAESNLFRGRLTDIPQAIQAWEGWKGCGARIKAAASSHGRSLSFSVLQRQSWQLALQASNRLSGCRYHQ